MNKRLLLIPALVALANGCHSTPAAPRKIVTPVRVVPVEMYQPKTGARYSATILPGRQVGLGFRVAGIVASVYQVGGRALEPGDMIPAGTVLATLRQDDYNLSAAQARSQLEAATQNQRSANAQLEQARAAHVKALADFNRAKALYESQSLTRPDYDAAKAQLDAANAQVDGARAQVDTIAAQIKNAEAGVGSARLAQADTSLIAPFAAAVVQRNVEVGMLAGPSAVAYTLAGIDTVKAAFGVPDTVVVQTRIGHPLAITVEALPGREFRGQVSAVAAVADAETRLFQVEITIANPGGLLKPGMIASLVLEGGKAQPAVAVVPLGAVIRASSGPSDFAVMVVRNKVAAMRKVTLGPTFGELLAVTSGLEPGELVVRSGGTMIADGDAVEIVP